VLLLEGKWTVIWGYCTCWEVGEGYVGILHRLGYCTFFSDSTHFPIVLFCHQSVGLGRSRRKSVTCGWRCCSLCCMCTVCVNKHKQCVWIVFTFFTTVQTTARGEHESHHVHYIGRFTKKAQKTVDMLSVGPSVTMDTISGTGHWPPPPNIFMYFLLLLIVNCFI